MSLYYPQSIEDDFECMENCDVLWKPRGFLSKVLANYQLYLPKVIVDSLIEYEGKLINNEIEIPSANNPNVILVVKDDLLIKQGNLWINDQVFLKNGTRIIGNTLGIPYKFKKL